MKLTKGFITRMSGEEQIMVSAGKVRFNGLVRSNKSAAFIVDCLKKDTTVDAIVAAMLEKYDAPEEVLRADVLKIVETLRSIGAIEE